MTQEELKLVLDALKWCHGGEPCGTAEAIAVVEKALAQPEQEPVAYLCENAVGHKYFRWKKPPSTYKPIALYTTPPQRTWVGLTDEEIDVIDEATWDEDHKSWGIHDFARAVEAKLKEKNSA